MRRDLVIYLALLTALNVLCLAVMIFAGRINWTYLGVLNIFGVVCVSVSHVQQRIDYARPYSDQKSALYHAQSIALWWSGALATGLLIDLLVYLTDKQPAIFVGTVAFAILALVMTPLYLLGEWWTARHK